MKRTPKTGGVVCARYLHKSWAREMRETIVVPRVRVHRQRLRSEKPPVVLGRGGHEGRSAKSRLAQQQLRGREVVCGQGFFQHGAFSDRVTTPRRLGGKRAVP
jgi:hypothetical protein